MAECVVRAIKDPAGKVLNQISETHSNLWRCIAPLSQHAETSQHALQSSAAHHNASVTHTHTQSPQCTTCLCLQLSRELPLCSALCALVCVCVSMCVCACVRVSESARRRHPPTLPAYLPSSTAALLVFGSCVPLIGAASLAAASASSDPGQNRDSRTDRADLGLFSDAEVSFRQSNELGGDARRHSGTSPQINVP